jgi:hypothetical protein
MSVTVQAHDDGTLTIVHYGTTYHHWWLGETKKHRGHFTVRIYGKTGGESVILLSVQEKKLLDTARDQAQRLAYQKDGETWKEATVELKQEVDDAGR